MSEKQLADAIFAVQDTIGPILEFTVVIDDRAVPPSLGYLVEVEGQHRASLFISPSSHVRLNDAVLDPDADEAPAQVLTTLVMDNMDIMHTIETMGLPTIRIVRPGTFRDFRRRKIESTDGSASQTKVPVVMWDTTDQQWMFEHIEREVGCLHKCSAGLVVANMYRGTSQ